MDKKDLIFEMHNDVGINSYSQSKESRENTFQEIEDVIFPEYFKNFNFTVGQGKICSVSRS